MNWQAFSAELIAKFSDKPQNSAKVELACRQVAEGLQVLAGLGVPFHLVPGHVSGAEWPKTMFHATAPNGLIVYGPTQAGELGEGWFDSVAKAREWHGRKIQFIGRGGQRMPGLPVVIAATRQESLTNVERDLPVAKDSPAERKARIAKARAEAAGSQEKVA